MCANQWYVTAWKSDQSEVTDKTLLPVTALYMGRINYESWYRVGAMYLGNLEATVTSEFSSLVPISKPRSHFNCLHSLPTSQNMRLASCLFLQTTPPVLLAWTAHLIRPSAWPPPASLHRINVAATSLTMTQSFPTAS